MDAPNGRGYEVPSRYRFHSFEIVISRRGPGRDIAASGGRGSFHT